MLCIKLCLLWERWSILSWIKPFSVMGTMVHTVLCISISFVGKVVCALLYIAIYVVGDVVHTVLYISLFVVEIGGPDCPA